MKVSLIIAYIRIGAVGFLKVLATMLRLNLPGKYTRSHGRITKITYRNIKVRTFNRHFHIYAFKALEEVFWRTPG